MVGAIAGDITGSKFEFGDHELPVIELGIRRGFPL